MQVTLLSNKPLHKSFLFILQSERIMEENSIVRDLITKILDDGGPTDTGRLVIFVHLGFRFVI